MYEEIRKVIDTGRRFLILTHRHPDGDAIGSSLALQQILTRLGKEAIVLHKDHVPYSLRHIPSLDLWHVTDNLPDDFPDGYDALFIMECPKVNRTGFDIPEGTKIINMDHHISNTSYGDINIVDPHASCVGVLVWELAVKSYGLTLSPPITDHLYIALATDTGQFTYGNSDVRSFRMAADLVQSGTRPDAISGFLYEGYPASSVKLKGLILTTLELFFGGKIALLSYPLSFLAEAQAHTGDAEGVIDEPRRIEGVEVAVLIREMGENQVKVSMRSQGSINVETLAQRHGGGGHHNAAGFVLDGSLQEARRDVITKLEEFIEDETKRHTARR